ncbi:MAG: tetratricopeptide repeat protein [Phycisphaeraceae bacterium]|nr:MAG: tetratricopeptide repeat protein [Phycisphaeraceae bacterium]
MAPSDGGSTQGPEQGSGGPARTRWRDIWPLPLLLVAGGTLVAGVVMSLMTRPAPVFTPALERADHMISAGRYDDAIKELNDNVFPYLGRPELGVELEARFHTLLARALYRGQQELEFPQRVNDENVVKQYLASEKLNTKLAQTDIDALARTYVALDEPDRAKDRLRSLTDPADRDALYRLLIDSGLHKTRPDYANLLLTIEEMLASDGLDETDRVWAMARRAEAQLELGYTSEAINDLLREMPLLVGKDIPGLGELFVMLGRAYYDTGAYREAQRELERADRDDMLADSDPARAWARLYLAHVKTRLAADEDQLREARDGYEQIVQRSSNSGAFLPALLGLAETEADLGSDDASLESYGALVSELKARDDVPRPTREEVTASLLSRARSRNEAWRTGGGPQLVEFALRFAEIAGELYPLESTPADVLDVLSRINESAAYSTLGLPPDTERQQLDLEDLRTADPGTLQRAKRHLIRAASFARMHADLFVIDDYERYADSLWRSAQLSDSAGDRDQAIASFTTFAETVREDSRQAEARFRLGQMFQARGEYTTAADYYKGLIDEQQSSPNPGVGQWADLSYVPLAQCYILDVDDTNDGDALRLLQSAIDGTRGGPDRPEFRQAVLELGNLAFRDGRYAEAIEKFEEAIAREGDHGDEALVSYRLADSYRLLAEEIGHRLDEPMSERDAGMLADERAAHLRRAIELFTQVRDELGKRDPRTLTQLEETYLRNSSFYLGDCAFDLRSFEEAIEYYRMARSSYPGDPAVLVALMQIVNAYIELGDMRSARTANERARAFYQSLPKEVWDDPNLPLGRQEWERWLDSNAKLYQDSSVAEAPSQ